MIVNSHDARAEWMQDLIADVETHPTCRLTGVRLALHRNATTGLINPSTTTLAKEVGQSKRTVIRHIEHLIKAGWIEVDASFGRVNSYRLLMNKAVTPPVTGDVALSPVTPDVTGEGKTGDTAMARVDFVTGDKSIGVPVTESTATGDIRCHTKPFNPIKPLTRVREPLDEFRAAVGAEGWLLEDAEFQLPATLVLKNEYRCSETLKRYRSLIEKRGWEVTARRVA